MGMYFAYAQDVNALGEFVVNVENLLYLYTPVA